MNRQKKSKQTVEDFSTEFEEKVLFINRCAKVLKGGRKFSFSALILVGDNDGHIGYGFAKANELSDSIRKGAETAKRDILTVKMKGTTIPHEIIVRWDGAVLLLKPAPEGTGIIAGSKVRAILELAEKLNLRPPFRTFEPAIIPVPSGAGLRSRTAPSQRTIIS